MDFDDLKRAVESKYGGTAIRVQSVPVHIPRANDRAYKGVVHIFALTGHPEATLAYAWSLPTDSGAERRYYAALHIGPVNSPEEAIRLGSGEAKSKD